MRIVFDKNVPVGVRDFLPEHEVLTFDAMRWHPQLENGELLKAAEEAGFHVMITCDQNIEHQQNLSGRNLAIVALGSNIWPIVRGYAAAIAARVDSSTPGSYGFIEMPVPSGRRKKSGGRS